MNLRLFGQKFIKKIVFALRDFDKRDNNFEVLKSSIIDDIQQLWKSIYKPDPFKNSEIHDFFNFDFFCLPHKVYEPEVSFALYFLINASLILETLLGLN